MALCAENVSYRYPGGTAAARGVNLSLDRGELLGVIGPNGSGKSTLLRLLTGILAPESGAVTLDGAPLTAQPKETVARRVAFLPQRVVPAFAFTCEEVIAQGRYPHLSAMGFLTHEDLAAIRSCMEKTDTSRFADRPLDELSGGERQRVLIASAFAQGGDYLLFDEPTAALDIQHQASVFELLRASAREGAGVAVVVHDLNLAAQWCDRLALLSVGQVVAEGAPGDVLTLPNLAPVYGGAVAVGKNPLIGGPLVMALTTDPGEDAPCPS